MISPLPPLQIPNLDAAEAASHPGAVSSPMVGTAYLAPEPGAAVFAQPGTQVSEGQTVLIIEAMKTMNHIPAPRSGKLTVVPDKKEYEPGDTAKLLVMAPFQEGEGMVVWGRDGFSRQERFTLKNGTATLEQPLTEEMIPNMRANITCVGKAKWGQRERPAVAAAR